MENGAFAPKEQMLHFPKYFQIHDISKQQSKTCLKVKSLGLDVSGSGEVCMCISVRRREV